MSDTVFVRKLQLVKDESDKSNYVNKWISLEIKEAMPFLVVSKDMMDNSILTSIDNPSKETIDVKNTLDDNFIFVAEMRSFYSNSLYRLYYDKTTGELLYIPSTQYLGSNEDGDPYIGHTFNLVGYTIGLDRIVNSRVLMGTTTELNKPGEFKVPELNGNLSTKTLLVRMEGINYNSKNKEYLEMSATDPNNNSFGYSDPAMSSNPILELGKASDVFKDTTPFPMYGLVQQQLGINAVQYLGYGFPSDNEYVYLGIKG